MGCSFPFSEYLKTQGIRRVPLSSFKENRFNIVFHNAAGVYFLSEYVNVFLESTYSTGNKLLQAVLADVKVTEYVAIAGKVFKNHKSVLFLLRSMMSLFFGCTTANEIVKKHPDPKNLTPLLTYLLLLSRLFPT